MRGGTQLHGRRVRQDGQLPDHLRSGRDRRHEPAVAFKIRADGQAGRPDPHQFLACRQPSKREDVTVINVPVNDIAMELGNEKVANMVMLGALVRATDVVSESSIEKVMKKTLTGDKAELLGLNMKAFAYHK
jgi:hypothetical protein